MCYVNVYWMFSDKQSTERVEALPLKTSVIHQFKDATNKRYSTIGISDIFRVNNVMQDFGIAAD